MAGVVLIQKFIQPGGKAYTGYVDYMDRPEEIQLIRNMRRRNPHTGLVTFWVKLRQRGYTRSITGLYRFLKKQGMTAQKLPNPKYVAKPYEQMLYPGQRIQIDVKFVPSVCLVGDAER